MTPTACLSQRLNAKELCRPTSPRVSQIGWFKKSLRNVLSVEPSEVIGSSEIGQPSEISNSKVEHPTQNILTHRTFLCILDDSGKTMLYIFANYFSAITFSIPNKSARNLHPSISPWPPYYWHTTTTCYHMRTEVSARPVAGHSFVPLSAVSSL